MRNSFPAVRPPSLLLSAQEHRFLQKTLQPDCASYVCVRVSAYEHNGGCVLGVELDCVSTCTRIYVYNGSDSWPAVNVCNKAEQAKWWKSPGVRDSAGSWETLAFGRECVCVCVCLCPYEEIKTVGEKGVGVFDMCVRECLRAAVWKWNRAGVGLGEHTPKQGCWMCTAQLKCVRVCVVVCLAPVPINLAAMVKMAAARPQEKNTEVHDENFNLQLSASREFNPTPQSFYRTGWYWNNRLHESSLITWQIEEP